MRPTVTETTDRLVITTRALEASVRKRGYVSGVEGGSLLDRKTGFRDAGFGLDVVDWLMEPGSDEAYRAQLTEELIYEFGNPLHGRQPKRSVEGPQICTQAGELALTARTGEDFVAVQTSYCFPLAAPGKVAGSLWEQTLVFPENERYFLSCDRITSVNASDALFLRIDMPGHIRHDRGDTFSEVYLSYAGILPADTFADDFAPDERFGYRRGEQPLPERFIRAYHLPDPRTGADGPWLAGMTLAPAVVSEAWCHQRGYVCLIEEFGGSPIQPGESFSAAFIVGFFDTIDEMHRVYDRYAGATGLEVSEAGWQTTPEAAGR